MNAITYSIRAYRTHFYLYFGECLKGLVRGPRIVRRVPSPLRRAPYEPRGPHGTATFCYFTPPPSDSRTPLLRALHLPRSPPPYFLSSITPLATGSKESGPSISWAPGVSKCMHTRSFFPLHPTFDRFQRSPRS